MKLLVMKDNLVKKVEFLVKELPSFHIQTNKLEERILLIQKLLEIEDTTLTIDDIIVESYPLYKINSAKDAHLLIEKKIVGKDGEEYLYKIISVPSKVGEKNIFKNLKIKVPSNKHFGDRRDYINFCKRLSFFATGHGHKDNIHGIIVGEMAHRYLQFLQEFLSNNNERGYDRLKETLNQVVSKKEGYLDQLYFGSMLHDVGKCLIPEEILNMQRKPTFDELEIIKKHPYFGELITKGIPGIEMTYHITRYHHETWDGKGYEGLSGEDINFSSRITSLSDKVDAMLSSRSYRTKKYSYGEIKDLFLGINSDERGNFRGSLDPAIENILFREKIKIIENGKKRDKNVYELYFEDHSITRDRQKKLLAA